MEGEKVLEIFPNLIHAKIYEASLLFFGFQLQRQEIKKNIYTDFI